MNKLKSYAIGVLVGSAMTQCTLVTSDIIEAKQTAETENKNVYLLENGIFYLKYIAIK